VLEAIVPGHGDSETQAAGFEGAGGVGSLLLDVETWVAPAVKHRRPAFAKSDRGYIGQDARVAPHTETGGRGGGAGSDFITLRDVFELVHVVADIERACTKGTNGLGGISRDMVMTARTLEECDNSHILDVTELSARKIAFLDKKSGGSGTNRSVCGANRPGIGINDSSQFAGKVLCLAEKKLRLAQGKKSCCGKK
jgi:hypothetical protein